MSLSFDETTYKIVHTRQGFEVSAPMSDRVDLYIPPLWVRSMR